MGSATPPRLALIDKVRQVRGFGSDAHQRFHLRFHASLLLSYRRVIARPGASPGADYGEGDDGGGGFGEGGTRAGGGFVLDVRGGFSLDVHDGFVDGDDEAVVAVGAPYYFFGFIFNPDPRDPIADDKAGVALETFTEGREGFGVGLWPLEEESAQGMDPYGTGPF